MLKVNWFWVGLRMHEKIYKKQFNAEVTKQMLLQVKEVVITMWEFQ